MSENKKDVLTDMMMDRRELERSILLLCRSFESSWPLAITSIDFLFNHPMGSEREIADIEVVAKLRRHS
jgi:hypothetical protein